MSVENPGAATAAGDSARPTASSPGAPEDREIVITRVIDAPRSLVFQAWTDSRHVAQWWGPTGFTNTVCEMDVRPGGVWRFIMHGPDGVEYKNRVVYIEIVRAERLVYSHGGDDEDEPGQFHVTVTFAEQGGKTQLTMRMRFDSAAERDKTVEFGAIKGGNQTLDRLEKHLLKMQESRSHSSESHRQ